MNTSNFKMIAIVVAVALMANVATAKNSSVHPGAPTGSGPYGKGTPNGVKVAVNHGVNVGQKVTSTKSLPNGATVAGNHGVNVGERLDGGFKVTFGGNPPRGKGGKDCDHDRCSYDYGCDREHYRSNYGCFPAEEVCSTPTCGLSQSSYVVLPGDTFEIVSQKEYGTPSNSMLIAQFNRLPMNSALMPGQTLNLPPAN